MEYYNFGAGPGMLPPEVIDRIKVDLPHWQDGLSVMEVSHRSPDFMQLVESVEASLRSILNIPTNYKVLFIQGGARSQFAMIPMNLLGNKKTADYVITGLWSKIAYEDGCQFCNGAIAVTNEFNDCDSIPAQKTWVLNKDAAYVHYTDNESLDGVEFNYVPETRGVPLVSDMTSNLLTKTIDVSKFGLIYASTQKNLGVAGLTVVIVRDDCIKLAQEKTPLLYNYSAIAKHKSLMNTPPTFCWYVLSLMLHWIEKKGGIKVLEAANVKKAQKLYDYIDSSDFYYNNVVDSCRSRISIPFRIKEPFEPLTKEFVAFAKKHGILQIDGHRDVGGLRASLFNAMPLKGVDALINVMKEFKQKHRY